MLKRAVPLRFSWETLRTRPSHVQESSATGPSERLRLQLQWAKTRPQVGRLLEDVSATGRVGLAAPRRAGADDYALVLQKMCQTESSGRPHFDSAVAGTAALLLHARLAAPDAANEHDVLATPAQTLWSLALLLREFPGGLGGPDQAAAVAQRSLPALLLAACTRDDGRRLRPHEVSDALAGLRLLTAPGQSVEAASRAATVVLLHRCADPACHRSFAPVDVMRAFEAMACLAAPGAAASEEELAVVRGTVRVLGDLVVARMAVVFTPAQVCGVLRAMRAMGVAHAGLVGVLAERALHQHVLEAFTGEECAEVAYSLGCLRVGDAQVGVVEEGRHDLGLLAATNTAIKLPALSDHRVPEGPARQPAWRWRHNFAPVDDVGVEESCVWTVQTLAQHSLLRSVLANRKPVTPRSAAMLLSGGRAFGYTHPERSSALEQVLLMKLDEGGEDAAAAGTAPAKPVSSILWSPMRGTVPPGAVVAPVPGSDDATWAETYARSDWLLGASGGPRDHSADAHAMTVQESATPRRLLLDRAASDERRSRDEGECLWTCHTLRVCRAVPDSAAAAAAGVAPPLPSAPVEHVLLPAAAAAGVRAATRADPRKRLRALRAATTSSPAAPAAPVPQPPVAVPRASRAAMVSEMVEAVSAAVARLWPGMAMSRWEGVTVSRAGNPHKEAAAALWVLEGHGQPLLLHVNRAALRVVDAEDRGEESVQALPARGAPLKEVCRDHAYLIVVNEWEWAGLPSDEAKADFADAAVQAHVPPPPPPQQLSSASPASSLHAKVAAMPRSVKRKKKKKQKPASPPEV